jgi:hypothetical protein
VHPDGGRDPVPVQYGASDVDGAVFETVFHDVPVRRATRVPHAKLVIECLEVGRKSKPGFTAREDVKHARRAVDGPACQ